MFDFKILSEKEIKYNTTQSNNEKGAGKGNHNNQTNKTNMDKELQQVLASLFGENLLTLSEGQEVSAELALTQIKNLVQQNQSLTEVVASKDTEIQTLKEEKANLEKDMESYKEAKKNWDGHIKSFREETVAAYKKVSGEENVDQHISWRTKELPWRPSVLCVRPTMHSWRTNSRCTAIIAVLRTWAGHRLSIQR